MSEWKKTNEVHDKATGLRFETEARENGKDWYDWRVRVAGTTDAVRKVREVEYILHPTFPKRFHRKSDAATNFELQSAGWGEFDIVARVTFVDAVEKNVVVPLKFTKL